MLKQTQAQKSRADYYRAKGAAAVAESIATRARLARATVDGVSWWIGLDSTELNRRAHERFPHHEGRYREPNF